MDKMVEIACFQYPERAELLAELLRSEDIPCYIRNELSSRMLPDNSAIRVELLESDLPRALEIMKEKGYALPGEDEIADVATGDTALANRIPLLRNFSFEKQIVILIVLVIGLLAVLVCLGSYLSSTN